MRIRFVMYNAYGRGGGVLTVVRGLASKLAERHDVEVVSVIRWRDEPVHPYPEEVPIRTLLDWRPPAPSPDQPTWALEQPSRVVPQEDPSAKDYSLSTDLAMARYFRSVPDGALIGMNPGVNLALARFARPSVVRIAQDHRPFTVRREAMQEAMCNCLPRLDAFLTLTEADAEQYREMFGGGVDVRVMPNGIPPYTGAPSTLTNKVVTAAGHLKWGKGFDRLIEAWATVSERHPDWELRIFGEGPMRRQLVALIASLGLAGSARLMGYSTSLRDEIAASSIFVCSSRIEGYGMVLLEAMSCGVPVVSFDAPSGPASIITPYEDGFLVPNDDIAALAEAIIAMIELGEGGRRPMAQAALRKAAALSQSAIARRWEDLLEELQLAKR